MPSIDLLPVTPETLGRAALWAGGFFVALFVGAKFVPPIRRTGFRQPSGDRKEYELTGLQLFLLTHVVLGAGVAFGGWSLTPLLTHFWSLFVVANVIALVVTAWLFFVGRARLRRAGEPNDAVWRDVWFGPELNPTLFGVDLKMFMYQPSLIGLAVLNAAFAFAQWETYGTITPEMGLYQGFLWAYLFTHYVREDFMLSTWDIIAERFGFMLTWGDLVYVPFLYTLCGWWVMDRGFVAIEGGYTHEPLPLIYLLGVALLHVVAHVVFRGSNWQKDRFKRDPSRPIWGKPPETLGGRLLISGWWGIGRKINYTGEIGVYLSFALCAGFASPWPYVLPGTLIVLLTQRAGRDDRKCRQKYGELWEQYCRKARFRILPFVY